MLTLEMIESSSIELSNENTAVCKECGGYCCRSMGCEIFPQDVKKWFHTDTITKDHIHKLLSTGLIQLDWWDDDVRLVEFGYNEDYFTDHEYYDECYYLHMRNVHDPAVYGSFGGRCRALTDEGCILPWELRPTGGKSLVPVKRFYCTAELSKPHCALAWIPYHDILDEFRYSSDYDKTEYAAMHKLTESDWNKLIHGGD